jgi:hypothetical protein
MTPQFQFLVLVSKAHDMNIDLELSGLILHDIVDGGYNWQVYTYAMKLTRIGDEMRWFSDDDGYHRTFTKLDDDGYPPHLHQTVERVSSGCALAVYVCDQLAVDQDLWSRTRFGDGREQAERGSTTMSTSKW